MIDLLTELLAPETSPGAFLERHWGHTPLAQPGRAAAYARLLDWPRLETMIDKPGDETATLLFAREGVETPINEPTFRAARAAFGEGHTVVVRHGERRDPALGELALRFKAAFGRPVDIHFFVSPADQRGFGWHYDVEDVFIIQTVGAKDYEVRKNTVDPLPIRQAPADAKLIANEGHPFQFRCRLETGDWLYIPSGWWHRAQAVGGDSMHLSIGLMPATAFDLLDGLRAELARSLLWRQRLPFTGASSAAATVDHDYEALVEGLLPSIARRLKDPTFRDRLLGRTQPNHGA